MEQSGTGFPTRHAQNKEQDGIDHSRARHLIGETTEVQALIQHPMDSGFVKDAKGEIIPPHFIQQLTFEYDGKPVFVADWGGGVSKDPYVKFASRAARRATI